MKGIIGAIIGNSVGKQYAIKPTTDYNFRILYDKSNPGDDSIAIIATADWLITTNHTADEYIDKLHFWCNKYNYGLWHHELSTTFKEWIKEKKREPYNSYGNGSAMRVIPVGFYAKTWEECQELAEITAKVTHNHPEGIKGAVAVACVIFGIKNGNTKEEIKQWIEEEVGYKIKPYDTVKNYHKYECICQRSVPAALSCWYYGQSFEDTIRKAVSLGGDADTEAAIAGAFACASSEMEVDDKFATDLTRFFPMEYMEVLHQFHEQYEK